jgi:hypothetical protein
MRAEGIPSREVLRSAVCDDGRSGEAEVSERRVTGASRRDPDSESIFRLKIAESVYSRLAIQKSLFACIGPKPWL